MPKSLIEYALAQPESNKHCTKTENKITLHKDVKSKQIKSCKVDEITKTKKIRLEICANHLFN